MQDQDVGRALCDTVQMVDCVTIPMLELQGDALCALSAFAVVFWELELTDLEG